MNRKNFIKKALLGLASTTIGGGLLHANTKKEAIKLKNTDQVGFNHLPNKEIKTMKTVFHKADTRGSADHGWLKANHSFSFANYYNPERMSFGVLRVLNDDYIAGGKGFGRHPHNNMEIITIPLSGDLAHKDSMGNEAVIREGDVQVMSAGTGVHHSEFNNNPDKAVKLFQIWLFPNKENVKPRYDQIAIRDIKEQNKFYQILSPNSEDKGVWIHQDAWFHLGEFDAGKSEVYKLKKKGNGIYAMLIEGKAEIEGQKLEARDAFGLWDIDQITFNATSNAKILLLEVPMDI